MATRTSSVRRRSLWRLSIAVTWNFTVCGLMQTSSPIWWLSIPRAINRTISSSRSLNAGWLDSADRLSRPLARRGSK